MEVWGYYLIDNSHCKMYSVIEIYIWQFCIDLYAALCIGLKFKKCRPLIFVLAPPIPPTSDYSTWWLFQATSRAWWIASAGGKIPSRFEASVTRWLDCLLNLWPFLIMKICPIVLNFAKVGSKFCPKLNKHSNKWKNFFCHWAKSGHIERRMSHQNIIRCIEISIFGFFIWKLWTLSLDIFFI